MAAWASSLPGCSSDAKSAAGSGQAPVRTDSAVAAANLRAGVDELRSELAAGDARVEAYHGQFPVTDAAKDGHAGTSPLNAFPPNGYGLFDMAGNVWQWCSDWYRTDEHARSSKEVCINPAGPSDSYDPAHPHEARRVVKGGSFLCNASYCESYRPTARRGTPPDTGTSHTGFRCAASARGQ